MQLVGARGVDAQRPLPVRQLADVGLVETAARRRRDDRIHARQAVGTDHGARRLAGILVGVADPGQGREAVAGLVEQFAGDAAGVLEIDAAVVEAAAEVAVVLEPAAGDAERELVVDRPGVAADGLAQAEAAAGQAHRGLRVERGPAGHVVDRTGKGVAAVERTLRALDHLDPLEIGEVDVDRGLAGEVDAVQEHADVRRAEGLGRAADDRRRDHAAEDRREVEARGEVRDVAEPLDALALDVGRGEGGDRLRRALELFLALARGDDDRFERDGLRLARRRGLGALLGLGLGLRRGIGLGDGDSRAAGQRQGGDDRDGQGLRADRQAVHRFPLGIRVRGGAGRTTGDIHFAHLVRTMCAD